MILVLASSVAAAANKEAVWPALKEAYFGDRTIIESSDVIELDAPARAANAAAVPISITAKFPQSTQRYIRTLYLFVDNNPGPLAGKFHFEPRSSRADLVLRIRIQEYTLVRAIAETNDGKLHMSSRFVKASGGCSAPVSGDLDAAMAQLGRMKFRIPATPNAEKSTLAQLLVRHPNISGLQMDQISHLYIPAHFVRQVAVSVDGEPVFSAETGIGISENPSFRFYFVPSSGGELKAEVTDSNGLSFTHVQQISAGQ